MTSRPQLSPSLRDEHRWDREKGEVKAKPISRREVVSRVLERIGLTAGDNFAGKDPAVKGYYRRAQLDLQQNPSSGVEVNIRRKELADIGVAIHEAAHYYDDKLGITDLSQARGTAELRRW